MTDAGFEALVTQVVAAAKAEILSDVAAGHVPPVAMTFSALHDYADANEYGAATLAARCDDAWDAIEVMGRVQERLDTWLRGGGLRGE